MRRADGALGKWRKFLAGAHDGRGAAGVPSKRRRRQRVSYDVSMIDVDADVLAATRAKGLHSTPSRNSPR